VQLIRCQEVQSEAERADAPVYGAWPSRQVKTNKCCFCFLRHFSP
jgi:hypothetical protein